jgi:hypothetical protein
MPGYGYGATYVPITEKIGQKERAARRPRTVCHLLVSLESCPISWTTVAIRRPLRGSRSYSHYGQLINDVDSHALLGIPKWAEKLVTFVIGRGRYRIAGGGGRS